ncbi:MAG: TonB-dependent receptor [Williamsia sp.]|nr:TonB-dependent receptor [Williamsia sp.]
MPTIACGRLLPCLPVLSGTFRAGKPIFLLLCFLAFRTNANPLAQGVTLSQKNARLETVFKEIRKQTGYLFVYTDEMLGKSNPVTIEIRDATLPQVLELCFKNQPLEYTIYNKMVVIKEKPLAVQVTAIPEPPPAITIVGKISGEGGEPLNGASITEKGTSNTVTTRDDGGFSIQVADRNAVLVVSYVGYLTKELPVGSQNNLTIVLIQGTNNLNDVVVVGYGTARRKDLTGSVASVNSSKIRELSVTRLDQALLGKIAGVQVKPVSGEPGSTPQVRIRGVGSISAGSTPLYVVDGFPMFSIETINPNDIESIDVLKDASATAIYGSRGSNGVVIVNTKRGKAGKAVITFDSYYGLQKVSRKPSFLNAHDQAQYFYDGVKNRNLDAGNDVSGAPASWRLAVPQIILDVLSGKNTTDVDKVDAVLETAPVQQHQLGVSGGSENVRYAISGEYLNQDGIVLTSNFKRYSIRANIDAKVSKRLNVRFNVNQSLIRRRIVSATGVSTGGVNESVLGNAMSLTQFYPVFNPDGSYFIYSGLDAAGNYLNPVALANEIRNNQQTSFFLGNVNIEYAITKDLKFNALFGGSIRSLKGSKFFPQLPVFFSTPAYGTDTAFQAVNWLTEYTLNYNKTVGKHSLTALAGFTAQKETYSANYLYSNKYPNNLVTSLSAASGIITDGTASTGAWSLVSYLGRINYNYNGRYYLTASVRTDGSSRFGADKKYGLFPSAALAWRVSDENFMKGIGWLDEFKFRASYGETGNNNIGDYEQFATINYEKYPLNGTPVSGYAARSLPNPLLTWEKQQSINVGFDASFFNRRVNITADRFRSTNTNLLLRVNIPDITGFSNALQNIGQVRNSGWEFAANTVNLKGKFEWTTDLNLTVSRNKVLRLGPEGDPIITGGNITMIGQPIGMFYGWLTNGVFRNQAEVNAGPVFSPGTTTASHPGDTRFVDVSGPNGKPDGVINSFDKTIMGNPYPDFYYGINNRFSYKNFSLSVNMQGVHGNSILSVSRRGTFSTRGRFAISSLIGTDYWKSEQNPGDGSSPRPNDAPTGNIRGEYSQRWLDNGSYLRFNNITLGYTLPERLTGRLNVKTLRFYLTANNPFTITKNNGFNPDVSNGDNALTPGNDLNDYPLPKSILLGFNLAF